MQSRKSYIKNSGDFTRKIKGTQSIPSNKILFTADVVGLYPSIPNDSGLNTLKNILGKRRNQNISTADLIKMTTFVLRNNYLESNGKEKQIISGTAIGTKCGPTYVCIYIDEFENEFSVYGVTNFWSRLGISITFSLYEHMEKKNLVKKVITNLTSTLHVLPGKIVFLFLSWISIYQSVSLPQIYTSSLQIDTNIYILSHPT